MKSNKSIRVYMTGLSGNPYIKCLVHSLADLHVDVQPMPPQLTPDWLKGHISDSCRSILHLHWPAYSYMSSDRKETRKRIAAWGDGLRLARSLGYRIVWTAHNLYPHDGDHLDLQMQARRHLVANCDAIIVHCQSALAQIESAFGPVNAPMTVIPHANYVGLYGDPVGVRKARSYLGLSKARFVYLFLGQIRPYKGVPALIDAFQNMGPASGRVLLIAGYPATAALGRQLLARTRENPDLHVHPFYVPDDELPYYFGAANVIVLPYRNVLSSGAAILAHSMARPVIAPALGCLPEALQHDRGWLYDPNDPRALGRAMQNAMAADCFKMGRRCLEYVKRFPWPDAAASTLDVYRRVSFGVP